jgi:hypothetical protein
MKRNMIITTILLLIAVGIILVTMKKYALKTPDMQKPATTTDVVTEVPKGKMVTGSDLETFSGIITAVDTGCFSDAICSVTVNEKKVILVKGGRGLPPNTAVGKLVGVESIGDLETKIGQHANVYAGVTPEGDYSIYGNDKYYVEVVNIKR